MYVHKEEPPTNFADGSTLRGGLAVIEVAAKVFRFRAV